MAKFGETDALTILSIRNFLEELTIYYSKLKDNQALDSKKLKNQMDPVIEYFEQNKCDEQDDNGIGCQK